MSEPAVQNNEARTGPGSGGVTGKGFKPGQSGNPSGRPKGLAKAVRDVGKQLTGKEADVALAEFWWSIVNDEKADINHRLQAGKFLAERGYGKPAEYVPIDDPDPLGFDDETTRQMASELDKTLDELAERRAARA